MERNDKEVIFLFLRKILIAFDLIYFVCMHAYYSMQVEVRGWLGFQESVLSFHQVDFWDWVWSRPCSTPPVPVYSSFWARKLFITFFSRQGLCRPDLPWTHCIAEDDFFIWFFFSCLPLWSAGIIGTCRHTQGFMYSSQMFYQLSYSPSFYTLLRRHKVV